VVFHALCHETLHSATIVAAILCSVDVILLWFPPHMSGRWPLLGRYRSFSSADELYFWHYL